MLDEKEALNITKAAALSSVRTRFPMLANPILDEFVLAGVDIGWGCHKQHLMLKEKYGISTKATGLQ